jgi:rhodanese-related sulfurtransferase
MVGAALAGDVDPETVPVAKQTMAKNYLSAKEAAAMKESLGAKALMIDVRTPAELEYVGMADSVDKNIPYMMDDYTEWDDKKSRYMMAPNSGFLSTMSDSVKNLNLSKDDVVIVICRSGDRSSQAANLLTNAGYTKVYSVVDGFEGDMAKDGINKGRRAVNGWKNAGLPWSYNLIKNKMFIQ